MEPLEGMMIYRCKQCQTPLALCDDVLAKSFYCEDGRAYFFSKVVNVTVGEKVERMTISGTYTVADIICISCGSILGWTYVTAHFELQKYKEGKFVLVRCKILGPEDGSSQVGDADDHT